MNRIDQTFAATQSESRAAFVGYVCAGDPDFETSLRVCRTLIDSGVDILELGVPFSDPLADGLTNQLAAQRALESGMNGDGVLRLVKAIREFSEVPIVFYTYYNLVFSKGSEAYVREAKAAGVDGILTLDLPPEEADEHLQVCAKHSVQTVCIVAPTTPESRIPKICKATTGFVYYVSREGVTGEQSSMATNISDQVEVIRKHTDRPIVVGFGVSTPTHVRTIAEGADGVVVGSAIVNCIADNLNDSSAIEAALKAKMADLLSENSLKKA